MTGQVRRIRARLTGPRAVLAAVVAALLVVAGCAQLPDNSSPQALGTIDREPTSTAPPAPVAGQDPDLLLRDFLSATADPTNRHQAARQYLTTAAQTNWNDGASTVIVDKPDMLRESRTADAATYEIRAAKIGELEADGSYRASDSTTYEGKIQLAKVGNDWRIDQLPPGVVVDSNAFYKSYRRYSLYFSNSAGTSMVPDLRWVAAGKDQLTHWLLTLLTNGPQPALAPAVRNLLAAPVSLRGGATKANGDSVGVGVGTGGIQIDFTGASSLDQHGRDLLAAQVVLTLAGADILGPYLLLGDGKPLDERYASTGWTIGDVSSLSSMANAHNKIGLHAVRDGALVQVVDSGITPAPGYFGAAHNLQSVGLSPDGQLVAAVADSGLPAPAPARTLVIGNYDGGTPFSVAQGNSFTRPSWTADGGAVWTVVDGDRVIRAVHDRASGNVSVQDVDSSALFAAVPGGAGPVPRPPITDLRLSRDGARAALIAGGKVFLAVIVARPDGKYELAAPLPIAVNLSTPAVSLDWLTDDTIVVAREGNVDPVESLVIDGSEPTPETNQNLTPPVRIVSASPNTLYAADSRAVMQLQSDEPSTERFWREVQGLGANAVPVLPG